MLKTNKKEPKPSEKAVTPPVKQLTEAEITQRIRDDMVAKARMQQAAAAQINKILVDSDQQMIVEQVIKIIPKQ